MFYSSLFRPESLCNTLILPLCLLPFPTLLPASRWVGENHLRRLLLLGETPAVSTEHEGEPPAQGGPSAVRSPCRRSLRGKRLSSSRTWCCSQAPEAPSSWLMPFQTETCFSSYKCQMPGWWLVTRGSCRCLEQLWLIYFRVESCFSPILNLKRALQPWSQYSPDPTHESCRLNNLLAPSEWKTLQYLGLMQLCYWKNLKICEQHLQPCAQGNN